MDTSKYYILMCSKAKEVQEEFGTGVIEGEPLFNESYYYLPYKEEYADKYEWITEDVWDDWTKYGLNTGHEYNYLILDSTEFSDSDELEVKKDLIWLPRQDQLQQMYWQGLTEQAKAKGFVKWLETKAIYNPHTYSLEMLWLMFYMYDKYNKKWNSASNIQEWEGVTK